jgi:hypothetical protein
MNKIFKLTSAAILAGSFVLPVFSLARAEDGDYGFAHNRGHVQRVGAARTQDQYLDSHPDENRDLTNNPRLVDNREYVKNHPDLKNYMREHPNMRHAWKSHPRHAMHHEEKWEARHDRD